MNEAKNVVSIVDLEDTIDWETDKMTLMKRDDGGFRIVYVHDR